MNIGGLQKLTLIDYPEKMACTVFLMGCNYRCGFCHNPELVSPEIMEKHFPIAEKDFFQFLKERAGYLEGVCISGGEPTINPELPEFCRKIKELGYKIKLDTNGSNPEMLKELVDKKLIDYAAMDIKAPKAKYAKAVGFADLAANYLVGKVEQSIDFFKKGKIDYEFRTTVVPGILTRQDVLDIADWLRPAKKYVLQSFRPEKTLEIKFASIEPYPDDLLISLAGTLSPFFDSVKVR
jgi:pyruvate formate lyase activating enzyme